MISQILFNALDEILFLADAVAVPVIRSELDGSCNSRLNTLLELTEKYFKGFWIILAKVTRTWKRSVHLSRCVQGRLRDAGTTCCADWFCRVLVSHDIVDVATTGPVKKGQRVVDDVRETGCTPGAAIGTRLSSQPVRCVPEKSSGVLGVVKPGRADVVERACCVVVPVTYVAPGAQPIRIHPVHRVVTRIGVGLTGFTDQGIHVQELPRGGVVVAPYCCTYSARASPNSCLETMLSWRLLRPFPWRRDIYESDPARFILSATRSKSSRDSASLSH